MRLKELNTPEIIYNGGMIITLTHTFNKINITPAGVGIFKYKGWLDKNGNFNEYSEEVENLSKEELIEVNDDETNGKPKDDYRISDLFAAVDRKKLNN